MTWSLKEEVDPRRAALHRLTVLISRTSSLLKASCSVVDASALTAQATGSPRIQRGQRLQIGQLSQLVSKLVVEDGIDLQGGDRRLSTRFEDLDRVIKRQGSDERYCDALCEVQAQLFDQKAGSLLLETTIEPHLLEAIAISLRAQITELSHLAEEMTDIFSPAGGAIGADLEAEVERVVDRFADQVKQKNRKLRFFSPQLIVPIVFLGREDLRRILTLLIDNGLKYTLDMRAGKPSWVDVKIHSASDAVEVTIESWGCPVFVEEEESVFDEGVRGEAAKLLGIKGHGQGLTEARKLARSFGGDIRIFSHGHPSRASWRLGERLQTWAILRIPVSASDKSEA